MFGRSHGPRNATSSLPSTVDVVGGYGLTVPARLLLLDEPDDRRELQRQLGLRVGRCATTPGKQQSTEDERRSEATAGGSGHGRIVRTTADVAANGAGSLR